MTNSNIGHRSALPFLILLLAGCMDAESQPSSTPERVAEPTHLFVVLDRSSSVTDAEAQGYKQLAERVIDGLSYGDRFTILVAYAEGRGGGTPLVNREMPGAMNVQQPLPKERSALAAAQQSLRGAVVPLLDAPVTDWTDLFSSFRTAGDYFAGSQEHSHVLMVLSDMLQCTPGRLCMDNQRFRGEPPEFLEAQRDIGTLPDLEGTCVWVFGAERASPRDHHVFEFWADYFEFTGAAFNEKQYSYAPVGGPRSNCPRG